MTTFAQRSFARGEITPALYARTDTAGYLTGLRNLRNYRVLRHGGAESRPGTQFIAQANSVLPVRLIKFVFNASQTYVLEFGNQYMRVYKLGVQLTDVTKTISGATNANPCVITATGHGFSNGNEVQISGIVGPIGQYLNGRNFKVAGVTANTFQLQYLNGTNVNSTTFGAYTSGGSASRVYQIATPFLSADLAGLKFVQSADTVTIVHHSYAPQELDRAGDTSWTLTAVSFGASIAAPASITPGVSPPAGALNIDYVVTSISDATGEESFPTATFVHFASVAYPTASNPAGISWAAVVGASNYNIYRSVGGQIYGLIAIATGTAFTDVGGAADTSITPPSGSYPFFGAGNFPSAVGYYQQRLCFAGTDNNPETFFGSRTGKFKNFSISAPVTQDDDAITFTLVGKQVNLIQDLVDVGTLLVLTSGGEWALQGDPTGTLTPAAINPKQYSYNGSGILPPIVIDNTVLYVQARGSFIRDLAFDFLIDGYRGNDLTIFSQHLFEGFTINDWDYAQVPNSIIWAGRNDGKFLGLTYVREQQMLAWHRHDLQGGFIENVCVVPEGNEDMFYMTVSRFINGQFVRYIERMSSRLFKDVIDFTGMDAFLSLDGRNTDPLKTMTLTGGSGNWDYTQTLTLTSSTAQFTASDVGNSVFLNILDDEGNLLTQTRCKITAYTSSTVVSVKPNANVPVALQGTATFNWEKAVAQVGGLWHLEGQQVSILADRYVVGSPNNPAYPIYTVTNGVVTLDQPYAVIHVGLPITCDLETLDIDTQGETSIADKKKLINRVTVYVKDSRSLWAGGAEPEGDDGDSDSDDTSPLDGLTELKIREDEDYGQPVSLTTKAVQINIEPEWNSNGRVFIRHVDPLPLTILAVMPGGLVPIGR